MQNQLSEAEKYLLKIPEMASLIAHLDFLVGEKYFNDSAIDAFLALIHKRYGFYNISQSMTDSLLKESKNNSAALVEALQQFTIMSRKEQTNGNNDKQ